MIPPAFDDFLDRFGGDKANWPEDGRADADRLLLESAQARRALGAMQEAETLYRLLRVDAGAGADATAFRAMRHAQARRPRRAVLRVGWAAAAAAALAIGILVGGTGSTVYDDETPVVFTAVIGSAEAAYVD